ncbi:MAG: DUF5050 domain-containing protein [Clostridia bacterium]|nr:DUF5050 domain-containing protein [Clostridia bacterium]
MKKLLLALVLLACFFALSIAAYADSPITSTPFSEAYMDVDIVKEAKESKIMTPKIAQYLASQTNPIDVKAAVINALGWDTDGKNNAAYFSEYLYKKSVKDLDLDTLEGDILFCLGYLTVMDDYFSPEKALPILEKAQVKLKDNFTVSIITSLVKAQTYMHTGEWYSVWKVTEEVLNNKALKSDLRPEALTIIIDYMGLYSKYFEFDPTFVSINEGSSITVNIRGGTAPYKVVDSTIISSSEYLPLTYGNIDKFILSPFAKADVKISGSNATVTGISAGTVFVTFSDAKSNTVSLPIVVNPMGLENRLKNAIVLFIGSSKAVVKNTETNIDPANPSVKPIVKNGRTLVPVSFVAQSLGAKITWDKVTSTATISLNNKVIKLKTGSKKMLVNNKEVILDVAAESINNRLHIPLAKLADALGKKVFYSSGLIVISDTDNIFDIASEKKLIDEAITMFEVNKYGNTTSNISNFGFTAKQGNWIYYADIFNDTGLYKMKLNGTDKTKISDDSCLNINVIGDWIYYSNSSDEGKIYKVNLDGSNKEKVSDVAADSLYVTGGWIYYSNASEDGEIFKVKTDGTSNTRLNDSESCNLIVVGDWIYYIDDSADADMFKGNIYKIKTDGTEMTKLSDDSTYTINVEDNWLYYTNDSDGSKIYKVKTDGSEKAKLTDDNSNTFNISNGWAYYSNYSDGDSLYKIKLDGTGKTKLNSEISLPINIIGEHIYYFGAPKELTNTRDLYKINIDGTGMVKFQ